MRGVDVNTGSNTTSQGPPDLNVIARSRGRGRFMTVMLPALLIVYVAVPLAAARK